MVASAFKVVLPQGCHNLEDDCDTVICWAESATQAKDLAAAASGNDAGAWTDATATALVVGAELEGMVFRIDLTDNLTPFTLKSASYTAADGDVIDTVGTALAAALVTAGVAGAAYNTGTNVLTIVETTDAMGDWHIVASAKMPSGDSSKTISGIFGAITGEGAQGIARLSTLVASFPVQYGMFRAKR